MRILRQGVHCQQRDAEVLLRQLCRRSQEREEEKKWRLPQSRGASHRTERTGVSTFSKAAILMGCSRQYIYKLVSQGKLRASRISSRMAIIRRADIETMLESNPYNKVVFGNRPKTANLKHHKKKQEPKSVADEPLTYISDEEVMSVYKVKQMWLYTTAKRNGIPMYRIAGRNYYSKHHVENCPGLTVDTSSITEWFTTDDVFAEFGMSATAIRTYAYRHGIPTKKEYGTTYYSKIHLAELRQMDMMADEHYCTVDEVSEKYGLSKANIHHIVKVNNCNKQILNRHFLVKLNRHIIAETLC